jgi:hypothetical protein
MAKKNNGVKDMHRLVLFGGNSNQEVKKKETVSIEYVDQEDKIKLVYKLQPFSGHYLYSLLILNQSMAPITELKIRIRFPDFLTLCRSTPPTVRIDSMIIEEDEKQVKLDFEDLKANSQKQINLFFCPTLLEEKGEIKSFLTFVNNADFVRAIDSDTVSIKFDPFTIERRILPTAEVKQFINKPEVKKAIRSIGIARDKVFDIDFFFSQIVKVTQSQNFQLISKDKVNKIAWFYGTELVSGDDILVTGQVISGKIEWLAASENPHLLITILTNFINQFKEEMILLGIISSIDQLINLECKYCGNILQHFPKTGQSIKCSKCNYEQIVWK